MDTLPGIARRMVLNIAAHNMVDPAMPGSFSLAAMATPIGPWVQWEQPFWTPVTWWATTVADPGERKTPVVKPLLQPLLDWQEDERSAQRPTVDMQAAIHRTAKKRVERAENEMAKAKDANDQRLAQEELRQALEYLRDNPAPVELDFIKDNITPMALAERLAQQGGRLGLLSSESEFFNMLGEFNKQPLLAVWLAAHGGDWGDTDRLSREATDLPKTPGCSIGILVQPGHINKVLTRSDEVGRGLFARMHFSFPKSYRGSRKVALPPLDQSIAREWAEFIFRLCDWAERHRNTPFRLRLTPEADAIYREWWEQHEARLRPDGIGDLGEPDVLVGWANKTHGELLRHAGITHVADAIGARKEPTNNVDADIIRRSIKFMDEYDIPNALIAFGIEALPIEVQAARRIVAWVTDPRYADKERTVREVYQNIRKSFGADEIRAGLTLLEEHEYVRRLEGEKRAGRSSEAFEVNPEVLRTVGTGVRHSGKSEEPSVPLKGFEDSGYRTNASKRDRQPPETPTGKDPGTQSPQKGEQTMTQDESIEFVLQQAEEEAVPITCAVDECLHTELWDGSDKCAMHFFEAEAAYPEVEEVHP